MFAKINSAGLFGVQGFMVEVEANAAEGIPQFNLTGALSAETREAQYRVWNAIQNSSIRLKPQKITVNLSPADRRKDGSLYDLPIAASLLAAAGIIERDRLKEAALFGELGLDGSLKPVRGVLPLSLTAKEAGMRVIIVPKGNEREAALCEDIEVVGCESLRGFLERFGRAQPGDGEKKKNREKGEANRGSLYEERYDVDFSDIRGQAYLKRAAEIAVSGRHNLLLSGPAGTGKTMIAKRMPTIMPVLTRKENIEISKIYSICGLLTEDEPLLSRRPFRSPHHGITISAFTGGGNAAVPGEISLASGGILFLDELPLFQRTVIEALRQPMEDRLITVTRHRGSYTYPADFMLVAAQNNCPCGYFPDRSRCKCTPAQIRAYVGRLSRPILERIDICAEAMPVSFEELCRSWEKEETKQEKDGTKQKKEALLPGGAGNRKPEVTAAIGKEEGGEAIYTKKSGETEEKTESSSDIRKRVMAVQEIQKERFRDIEGVNCNSRMGIHEIERFCVIGREEKRYVKQLFEKKRLSGRTYHKILRVARTIADMEGMEQIQMEQLAEAISYRSIEERLFDIRGI